MKHQSKHLSWKDLPPVKPLPRKIDFVFDRVTGDIYTDMDIWEFISSDAITKSVLEREEYEKEEARKKVRNKTEGH
jgi:hypothetical protein